MDKRLEEIVKNIDKMTVKPDDTFNFGCVRCGACCRYRYDILLNPQDVFRISKHLGITTVEFWKTYCDTYIGESSKVPILRLIWKGKDDHCVFFECGKGCSIHSVKPTVCATYPLGRYIKADKFETGNGDFATRDIRFLFQSTFCGNKKETHTVKEWLNSFNIPVEDEYYVKWNKFITLFGTYMNQNENVLSDRRKGDLYNLTIYSIYLFYDTSKDFEPQFDDNVRYVLKQIGKEW